MIDKFLRTLRNRRTYVSLVNLRFECVQDALEAAERYEEAEGHHMQGRAAPQGKAQ